MPSPNGSSRFFSACFRPCSAMSALNCLRRGPWQRCARASISTAKRCSVRAPCNSIAALMMRLCAESRSASTKLMRRASSLTAASSSSAGTASSARPIFTASRPHRLSPVIIRRFAHCGPTWYIHIWFGGVPLARVAGKPILAVSEQMMKSHISARSVPPARQLPCTLAMTGLCMSNRIIVSFCVCSMFQQSSSIDAFVDRYCESSQGGVSPSLKPA